MYQVDTDFKTPGPHDTRHRLRDAGTTRHRLRDAGTTRHRLRDAGTTRHSTQTSRRRGHTTLDTDFEMPGPHDTDFEMPGPHDTRHRLRDAGTTRHRLRDAGTTRHSTQTSRRRTTRHSTQTSRCRDHTTQTSRCRDHTTLDTDFKTPGPHDTDFEMPGPHDTRHRLWDARDHVTPGTTWHKFIFLLNNEYWGLPWQNRPVLVSTFYFVFPASTIALIYRRQVDQVFLPVNLYITPIEQTVIIIISILKTSAFFQAKLGLDICFRVKTNLWWHVTKVNSTNSGPVTIRQLSVHG